ncbi:MAG TPA: sigma-70 family RNA polymerase sigma factor, partial [Methylocystis sp.]|nr:sigma-70 family RNA polymerase sigma factor [Methylocystis sp.]
MNRPGFGELLVKELPRLRAYALSLSGGGAAADDLVQETLVKAWTNAASFQEGTNLRAWLITILRNTYFTQHQRRRREVADEDGKYSEQMAVDGDQMPTIELHEVQAAIDQLPPDQRDVISMICVGELSYEETCEALGLPMGTVKSRLNRARAHLAELMKIAPQRAVATSDRAQNAAKSAHRRGDLSITPSATQTR